MKVRDCNDPLPAQRSVNAVAPRDVGHAQAGASNHPAGAQSNIDRTPFAGDSP